MMNDFHYECLSGSLNEALAIHRVKKEPSRIFHYDTIDVKKSLKKQVFLKFNLPISYILALVLCKTWNKVAAIQQVRQWL